MSSCSGSAAVSAAISDLTCRACVSVDSKLAAHFALASVASLATSPVSDSSADVATSAVADSSAVTIAETAHDIVDCSRVVVWQVFASSWVSMSEPVVVRQPGQPPFDCHNSAAYRGSSGAGCDLVGSAGSLVVRSSRLDADSHASPGSEASSEIVAGIAFAAELHEMIRERVVGPLDSSRDAGADAVVVAVDDFEVSGSGEIVGSVGCRVVADRRAGVRNWTDRVRCGCNRDVEPTRNENSGAGRRSRHRAAVPEPVVVASDTSGVHFVDSAGIFYVAPLAVPSAADAETVELIRSLVAAACCSSCSAATCTRPAFASDPVDTRSCVGDS